MIEFDVGWLQQNKVDSLNAITPVPITSIPDLNSFLARVKVNRLTRSTINNEDSSRSHLFLLFKIVRKSRPPVQVLVSDLGGSENPFEYCGIAAIEGFYIINSLHQIKQVIKASSVSTIGNLPTKYGISPNKIVNKNFNRRESKFADFIEYVNGSDLDDTFAIRTVFGSIITPKTIAYTFLNIRGYKDKSVGLKQDIANTLGMVGDLKKPRGFGKVRRRIRRTSRKRAKAHKRVKSQSSRKKRKSKKRTSKRRSRSRR
jgi:hypothetical protein